jgi:hypothetical protein
MYLLELPRGRSKIIVEVEVEVSRKVCTREVIRTLELHNPKQKKGLAIFVRCRRAVAVASWLRDFEGRAGTSTAGESVVVRSLSPSHRHRIALHCVIASSYLLVVV